jgi:hypothetical protein
VVQAWVLAFVLVVLEPLITAVSLKLRHSTMPVVYLPPP